MSLLPVVMPERAVALILAVGWALVLFLGQGLLIGLVVAALLRALRDRSADLRYGVACAGLLVMSVCPLVTTAGGLAAGRGESSPRPRGAAATVGVVVLESGRDLAAVPSGAVPVLVPGGEGVGAVATGAAPVVWRDRVQACLPMVVAAWLVGVCVLAVRLVKGLVDVRGLTRRGLLGPTEKIQATIGRLVERAGLRRPVIAWLSARVEVPTVVGWLRPRVLIPAGILARLTFQQLEALLAHEIAHIRRHDYLVNIGQIVVEALLFFHPAVWWVSRRIRIERENCCDDMAVALRGGDRLLLARALFAMEEQRGTPILRVAASGGSLRDRVRRLVLPSSATASPAESGWAGVGLIAAAIGLVVVAWLAGTTHARDDSPRAGKASVHGRVLDESGQPVAGARVRLYRRDGRWEHRHPMIEETTAGPDGSFRLTSSLETVPGFRSYSLPPYLLLADHPGKAVGWRTIPIESTAFEGNLILTAPIERTITVTDADGRPMPGAKVVATYLGDPSSPSSAFRDVLAWIRPDDGPLTAIADASGRATLRQLPRTEGRFIAGKPGFAENYAYNDQNTIRLNVRIWGFDQGTGGSSRFNAYTDAQGRATFYSTPGQTWLGIVGPPEGYYLKGDIQQWPGSSKRFDFPGGETEIRLVSPRIAGPLIAISGVCTEPDGSPVAGAGISAGVDRFVTSGNTNYYRMRRADGAGRFTLEGVPGGQTLQFYAESGDRQLAGTATVRMPDQTDPKFQLHVSMEPTVVVDIVVQDNQGKPMPSRKFHIGPKIGREDLPYFPFTRRTVESDAEGRVKLDGIIPGLSYRVQEDVPPLPRGVPVPVAGRGHWYDEVLVLAPKEGK